MLDDHEHVWNKAAIFLGIGMAIMGGIVNWYSRVRAGSTRPFNVIELIGEIVTSGFVGGVVFMSMDAMGFPVGACASGAGIGGHMGTRLLFIVEQRAEAWVKTFDPNKNQGH